MASLFGICSNNMQVVQAALLQKKLKVQALHYDLKRLKNKQYIKKLNESDVVLVDSVRAYHGSLSILRTLNNVITIFDNPALLRQHEGLHILDVSGSEDILKYEFVNKPLDLDIIVKAARRKTQPATPIVRDRKDILEEVIKTYTVSGFLDKFNTYVYAATTPLHRKSVKTLLVQFIFGNIKEPALLAGIRNYVKDTLNNRQLLQVVIDYMSTPPGQQLQKALKYAQEMENAASKNSRRAIAYRKIGEMIGVASFELRNIIILYRAAK
jgi:hypothetical protein